ncbi:sensor histidine kinase [Actinomycetospora chibensis]|uniref:histidine kinase n=1 Tax=Actinomycetospora chibensis TaxID=663606 RepID=A0ABV9RLI4_9PSEU|nr:sensor histidine kinase [Actinomycetospora chibensis]MDD7922700.1 sensor histidine kinase [Actinomycetospora chibensis]
MGDTALGAARRRLVPAVVDVGLGVTVAAVVLVAAFAGIGPASTSNPRGLDVGAFALAAALAGALGIRRRHPVAALVGLNSVVVLWFVGPYPGRLVALAPLLGCYALAADRGWRWGLAGAVLTAAVQILAIRVVLGDVDTVGVVPIAVLLAATAGSAGAAVGYYRALLASTRAELARETSFREERTRRLIAEERLRIARELHDVVGHSMATISVQAGVGLHVLEQRPGQAGEALAAIKRICDAGLTDVKAVLGALRTPSGDVEQSCGLDRLPTLLETVEGAGLRVELDLDVGGRALPVPVDLAAYRIVQEALTNVIRHARARTVWLAVEHRPPRLTLRIRDDGTAPPATDGWGQGIDGMRERARALAGSLTAGPYPDGGFEVCAELPVPEVR